MDRKKAIYLVISLAVVMFVLWLIQSEMNRFSWRETYDMESEEPYGCFAIHSLLEGYGTANEVYTITDSVAGNLPKIIFPDPSSYIFIGNGMYMRPQDTEELLAFVEAGNTAFIATKVLPFDLMFKLYYDECSYEPWNDLSNHTDTSVVLNFTHTSLHRPVDFPFIYNTNQETMTTYWKYFPEVYFCEMEGGMVSIGQINGSMTNFVKVSYGSGSFYLHSNPRVFSNYFLVKEKGREYAELALSHLASGPIYWDEYSKVSERMAMEQNNDFANRPPPRQLNSESPLQYVLEQPPLAWAWYLLFGLGVLYMIFRTRRRQRVIPVIEPKKNTSLQFLNTIGRLYYQRANHQQVAEQAIKLLRTYVWEKYHLKWKENDEGFIKQLSVRSGTEEELVSSIVKDATNIPRYTSLLEGELVKFHRRLERFYAESK